MCGVNRDEGLAPDLLRDLNAHGRICALHVCVLCVEKRLDCDALSQSAEWIGHCVSELKAVPTRTGASQWTDDTVRV